MHTMKVLTIVLIAFAVAVIQPVEAQILSKSIYVQYWNRKHICMY